MKPTNSLIAFLLTAITFISLTSCQKEVSYEPGYNGNGNNNGSNGNGGSIVSTGTFTAKINGAAWAAASDKQSATIIAGVINLSGISSNGQLITISLIGDTVGTYYLSQSAGDGAAIYQPSYTNAAKSYTSNSSDDENLSGGKLIVTSIDKDKKVIKGTFEAKLLYNVDGTSYTVTEGAFDLTYATSIPTTPGGGTTSGSAYLKATIDGTAWQAQNVSGFDVQGKIMINGTTTDVTKTIGLAIPDNIAVGTYSFTQLGDYIALYNVGPNISSIVTYSAASGTLKITEHNTSTKKITGTFDFKGEVLLDASKKVDITSGSFSLTYQ
jgi:hypothetical protein